MKGLNSYVCLPRRCCGRHRKWRRKGRRRRRSTVDRAKANLVLDLNMTSLLLLLFFLMIFFNYYQVREEIHYVSYNLINNQW